MPSAALPATWKKTESVCSSPCLCGRGFSAADSSGRKVKYEQNMNFLLTEGGINDLMVEKMNNL